MCAQLTISWLIDPRDPLFGLLQCGESGKQAWLVFGAVPDHCECGPAAHDVLHDVLSKGCVQKERPML